MNKSQRASVHKALSVAVLAQGLHTPSLHHSLLLLTFRMSERQELLRAAWHGGQDGRLSAQGEARAWALREAWKATHTSVYGMWAFVAAHVTKVGGGNPTPSAVQQLVEKIDADPEWYPGKAEVNARGPKSVITARNQNVAAQSAMSMKARKIEPTYPALVAANPVALLNPNTGKPVDKKRVYAILRERCYDDPGNPQDTWAHHVRFSKNALTDENMAKRRHKPHRGVVLPKFSVDGYLQQHPGAHGAETAADDLGTQGFQRLDERGKQGKLYQPAWEEVLTEAELLGRNPCVVGSDINTRQVACRDPWHRVPRGDR